MIKIIEPGTRTITKCTECGCKFSYEEEDIKNGSRKRCIECPQCHKEIVLTATR